MNQRFSILFILLFTILSLASKGQKKERLDSLNTRYSKVAGREKIETLLELSRFYWDIDPAEGIRKASQALGVAENIGYDKQTMKAYYYLGSVYYIDNQLENSLENLLEALRLAKSKKYVKDIADISQQLALVYYVPKKLTKTYDYTIKALNIYESKGDKEGIAKCNNLIGLYYKGIGEYAEAIKCFQKSLQISEELGNQSIIRSVLNDFGSLYTEIGDISKALKIYKKAILYHECESPTFKSGEFELNLASLYIRNGALQKAKDHLEQGYKIARNLKSNRLKKEYYRILANCYTKEGKDKLAVSAFQKLQVYQDSLSSDQLSNKIEDINYQHEQAIKTQREESWKAKTQAQDLRINQQYIVGLLIVLGFLVILFLLIIRYRNNLKDNELLFLRNSLVSQHQEELIEAMKRLKDSEDKLRSANQTKDKMFSLIAHDLRGAVGNISNGLRMYLDDDDLNLTEEEKTEFLQALFHSSDNAYELLENLLYWAKNQTESLSANKQMVDASSIINSNIGLLTDLARIKNINLFTSNNPSIKVFVDWNMINTVLRNLISNAIKFTNKGGYVELKSEIGENFVKISVIDNGIGMMQDQIDNIYGGKTTDGTAAEKGSGLGLNLCRDFLIKNQGRLMVQSKVDEGSIFAFIIPRRPMNNEKFEELRGTDPFISQVID